MCVHVRMSAVYTRRERARCVFCLSFFFLTSSPFLCHRCPRDVDERDPLPLCQPTYAHACSFFFSPHLYPSKSPGSSTSSPFSTPHVSLFSFLRYHRSHACVMAAVTRTELSAANHLVLLLLLFPTVQETAEGEPGETGDATVYVYVSVCVCASSKQIHNPHEGKTPSKKKATANSRSNDQVNRIVSSSSYGGRLLFICVVCVCVYL